MDELFDLARDLIDSAGDDSLKWEEIDAFGGTAFRVSIGEFTASIRHYFDADAEVSHCVFSLINSYGAVVGAVDRDQYSDGYSVLNRLHEIAGASARNLKDAVSVVRSLLKKKTSK